MITVNNLVHHEFIGLSVSVTSVSNESLRLKGTVIDETKNTIKIEVDDNVEKIIPKKVQYLYSNFQLERKLKLMVIFCQFVLKIE